MQLLSRYYHVIFVLLSRYYHVIFDCLLQCMCANIEYEIGYLKRYFLLLECAQFVRILRSVRTMVSRDILFELEAAINVRITCIKELSGNTR